MKNCPAIPEFELSDFEGSLSGMGREPDLSRYTRKTLMNHGLRPVIDHQAADIREPELADGVSFVQRVRRDHV